MPKKAAAPAEAPAPAVSRVGDTRPNPETGHRQVLIGKGKGSQWVDKVEAKREDLPGGGILVKGFRKHPDELRGKLDAIIEAQGGSQSPEARRHLAALRVEADPQAAETIKKSAQAAESPWTDKRPGAARTPKAKGDAVAKAQVRGVKASRQPMTGNDLYATVGSGVKDLHEHLMGIGRNVAVSRGVGHVWDTAMGHVKSATRELFHAQDLRQNRMGYRSLPHIANAAMFLHHAVSSLRDTNLQHPTMGSDDTKFYAQEAQRHAAKNGQGDVL